KSLGEVWPRARPSSREGTCAWAAGLMFLTASTTAAGAALEKLSTGPIWQFALPRSSWLKVVFTANGYSPSMDIFLAFSSEVKNFVHWTTACSFVLSDCFAAAQ